MRQGSRNVLIKVAHAPEAAQKTILDGHRKIGLLHSLRLQEALHAILRATHRRVDANRLVIDK